ncbi:MAG TPA: divalent cation transporter [Nitrosopumilaceae archaeon]|nr:divalent cation transporter [Nitrosopumilaceae archaeon]
MEEIKKTSKAKLIASALIPIVMLGLMIAYIFGPGSNFLGLGVALPEITIEKIEFLDSKIIATVRNTGHIDVEVVQADVNDRIQPAGIEPDKFLNRFETAKVIIPFAWNESEPYEIGLTLNDGTRFSKSVMAAVQTPEPNFELVSYFAIIGTYVGVIPVLIGLLWFPFIAKMSKSKYKFFLALTAGLLMFLGIDAIQEGLEISTTSLSGAFNGQLLVATVVVISFLGLYYSSEKLISRTTSNLTKPVTIGLMIAIGIGLHNLGEGLAIGAAVGLGEIALSTFLIVGFAIHNTTEGLAIAAPMAKGKPLIGKLVMMGMIAGTPAIFGAWIGGFIYSPFAAVVFLSIGAGAIFQVVVSILNWIRQDEEKTFSTMSVVSGFSVGMLIMYLTSIFV